MANEIGIAITSQNDVATRVLESGSPIISLHNDRLTRVLI